MAKLDTGQLQMLRSGMQKELKHSAEARFLQRLHCVMMIGQGYCCKEVAECFGMDQSTVARWMRHFLNFGIEGLRDDRISGRPAKLTPEQVKKLTWELQHSPLRFAYEYSRWDGRLLVSHLQQHYGVTLSIRQCQRLLKQLQPQAQ